MLYFAVSCSSEDSSRLKQIHWNICVWAVCDLSRSHSLSRHLPHVGTNDWHVLIRFKASNDTHSWTTTTATVKVSKTKQNERKRKELALKHAAQPKNLYYRLSDLDVWVSWTRLFYRLSIINRILCRAFFILCCLNDVKALFSLFLILSSHLINQQMPVYSSLWARSRTCRIL